LGIRAGVASRAFTIAVNTGPLPDSVLLQHSPDLLLQKMTDLRDKWSDLVVPGFGLDSITVGVHL